ncbi:hypothetical protein NC661_11600 [Aquibacillus koreensis]|uniref:Uncharacterized protein n=1 Tax=Aquibacillus koreensis TaxID=279446 RepID=A0A9X4AK24_9BACI|nr:hypothetical protein [Aquibacillus koreensis]MCT2535156.1 hypothetical protein [Aquibacillus koreensis]MDC3421015.1 hypothetical protein [Aquibacillus koreensis]
MEYREYWQIISEKGEELNTLISSYWNDYSGFDTWQFWVVLFLLISPLLLLYFKVDRTRIFEVLFFGYTVHILWTYTDIALERYRLFVHTYFISPAFPNAINMTASVIPVFFLLLYQYCTNRNKNFFLYAILLSAILAFPTAAFEIYILEMAELKKGFQLFHIFLIDIAIAYTAYLFTKLLLRWRR